MRGTCAWFLCLFVFLNLLSLSRDCWRWGWSRWCHSCHLQWAADLWKYSIEDKEEVSLCFSPKVHDGISNARLSSQVENDSQKRDCGHWWFRTLPLPPRHRLPWISSGTCVAATCPIFLTFVEKWRKSWVKKFWLDCDVEWTEKKYFTREKKEIYCYESERKAFNTVGCNRHAMQRTHMTTSTQCTHSWCRLPVQIREHPPLSSRYTAREHSLQVTDRHPKASTIRLWRKNRRKRLTSRKREKERKRVHLRLDRKQSVG